MLKQKTRNLLMVGTGAVCGLAAAPLVPAGAVKWPWIAAGGPLVFKTVALSKLMLGLAVVGGLGVLAYGMTRAEFKEQCSKAAAWVKRIGRDDGITSSTKATATAHSPDRARHETRFRENGSALRLTAVPQNPESAATLQVAADSITFTGQLGQCARILHRCTLQPSPEDFSSGAA